METFNVPVTTDEETCEKPHNENKEISKGEKIEDETNSKDTNIESCKDDSAPIKEKDIQLGEKIENETNSKYINIESCKDDSAALEEDDVQLGEKIENETNSKDTNIEISKDGSAAIEEEDIELGEVESSKDFGGNIDEDELLKDTEGDESCNIVSESSETVNPPPPDSNRNDDVDSTKDNCKQSTEDECKEKNEDMSVKENLNTGDGIPDSSNENVEDTEMNDSFNLELNEDDESNDCTSKGVEKSSEPSESANIRCREGEIPEGETAVTSSNSGNEPVEKNSDASLHSSSNANIEINKTSSSISDEIENDSSKSKADGSNNETIENVSLNIDDESNEKTNTSHDDENRNKSDSCDGTKFLHVDQENSRPEESFESMETGGEDPFAQTSDVAMDTSESVEKGGDLDRSEIPMETSESIEKGGDLDRSDVSMETSESTEKERDKSDVTTDASENLEKEKDLNKEPPNSNSEEMGVNDVASDSTGNSEVHLEKSSNRAEDESAACESNKIESNLTTENTSSGDKNINTVEDGSKKIDEKVEINKDSEVSVSDVNINKSKDVEISATVTIEDDVAPVENNQTRIPETVSAQKQKSGKQPGSRSKRKSSEEESSDSDIDIEELQSIDQRAPKRTPQRNAAKRAESQIKVLSQLYKEIKEGVNEDPNLNDKTFKKTNHRPAKDDAAEENLDDEAQTCFTCKKVGPCKVNVLTYGKTNYFCDNDCFVTFRDGPLIKPGEGGEIIPTSTVISQLKSADIQPVARAEFVRKCSTCTSVVNGDDEKTLSWETMDFCCEECLGKYQQELGSHCANCKGSVQQTSLGKYCVRFGYEVKQFCCSTCLEEFKKGLKVCSFCQKDISSGAEGFLAPVGDKGTFKDFCTQSCMEKYELMSSNQPPPSQMHPCHVCNTNKLVEIEVFLDSKVNKLCSDICFTAYKFANKLTVDRCDMCKKFFDKDAVGEKFNIFYEGVPHNFCCKTCMNVYILAKRKIVPCNWCKVKKYNFDMIKRVQNTGQVLMMCSLNCLTLYQVSINAVSSKRIKCDMCHSVAQAQYHLTMSDATIRNFCTYPCVMNFQQQYSKCPITLPGNDAPPIPTGAPKRVVPKNDAGIPSPMISSVTSLANGQPATATTTSTRPSGKLNLVARLCEPPVARNKFTQTRPIMTTKSITCRPHANSVETQTEEGFGKAVIPIPVPIYVPCPMAMYSMPFPVPVPFPLPIPVPVFLPTTRNSIKGIMEEIKRIKEKVPDDPFEAELLMMAEMVAEDKAQDKTSSDSEADNDADNDAGPPSPPNSDAEGEREGDEDGGGGGEDTGGGEAEEKEFTPETEEVAENSNTFGDDIMQMALKIATELDTPAASEDLETQLPSSNIQSAESSADGNSTETVKRETRGRKRAAPASKTTPKRNSSSEPKKRKSHHNSDTSSQASPAPAVDEPKPDANMKLKFTFGVNAWKSWVTQKNAEIERLNTTASKKLKPFKTDMLQLTTDELNFSLCLFLKEVKKPNGTPYAPDTIYYLCLGIQQYLFENGRIDNIFTDSYFETFTDALDEVAIKFSELFNDHHYIVTRVEEEHLWESKQLGAHSPHVLLSTLMFFNTKHFNLTNVNEHLLLSFSHIMKHWKRNQNQSGSSSGRAPGSRNVLLRFYPPQALVDDPNLKKKKVYEQQENEENPLRCPVKLYEFYLSKCPESVKNRNDVFYLQPERSCVPDSPVWYSTMALQREPLEKMLNRVKMVKEINIALLVP